MAGIKGKVDSMLFTVFNLFFTGIHGPDIGHTPWSDDLKVRSQRLNAQFKTDLVVSLAGCAVADCGCTLFSCNLYQFFCDCGTRHRGSQQVFVLIDSVGLYAGNDVMITEIIDNVFDI